MAGDDDLRLNTLHRFAKHSPRLVLHEYSHCEVPAGCGGVVLQWLDPARGVPALVRISGGELEASCWLDGEPLASNLARVRTGPRVLAVHLRRKQPGAHPFTVGAVYDGDPDAHLIRGPGPRWRCTAAPPGEGWTAPDHDDAAWAAPRLASAEQLAALESWERRGFAEAAEDERPVLVMETDELWLRVAFTAPEGPGE
jgi:hypothetical protein